MVEGLVMLDEVSFNESDCAAVYRAIVARRDVRRGFVDRPLSKELLQRHRSEPILAEDDRRASHRSAVVSELSSPWRGSLPRSDSDTNENGKLAEAVAKAIYPDTGEVLQYDEEGRVRS